MYDKFYFITRFVNNIFAVINNLLTRKVNKFSGPQTEFIVLGIRF